MISIILLVVVSLIVQDHIREDGSIRTTIEATAQYSSSFHTSGPQRCCSSYATAAPITNRNIAFHKAGVSQTSCPKINRTRTRNGRVRSIEIWKERLLDQKDAEEFMKLGVFAELSKWCNSKDDNAKIYRFEISRFRPACRLDAVVCERAHGSLRAMACIARCFRNLDLAGYLVQILDDIKSGKADPSKDEQSGN
jgi:hypothetical protein